MAGHTGDQGEVTRLLGDLGRGDKDAVNQLLPLVYDELHRLARSYFRRERGEHTLQPTALVHEAYIRLVDQRAPLESRGHFLAVAATQMRRILLDYARKHHAARRGGAGQKVLLEDTMAISHQKPVDIIALDAALQKLARARRRSVPGRRAAILRRIVGGGNRGGDGQLARHGQARLEFRARVPASRNHGRLS